MSFVPFFATNKFVAKDNRPVFQEKLVDHFFSEDEMRALFTLAMRVDIADNNDKADIILKMLPKGKFVELGTGTNRITLFRCGMAIKIALDRRGFIDNYTEYKRSYELPNYLARTYATNFLINISEYVTVMDQEEFIMNEKPIKSILRDLSESYLFNDIGFIMKNSYNWGYRQSKDSDDPEDRDIVILDYGYLYPLIGQSKDLMRCPKCGSKLEWSTNFTKLSCSNPNCRLDYSTTEIWRKMDTTLQEREDETYQKYFSEGASKVISQLEQEVTAHCLLVENNLKG